MITTTPTPTPDGIRFYTTGPRLRHRRWAQFWAWALRYFWMPCPLCGEMWAGYEYKDNGDPVVHLAGDGRCYVACPRHAWAP